VETDHHYDMSYDQDMGTDHHYDTSYDQDMGTDHHYDMSYDQDMGTDHHDDMGTDHHDDGCMWVNHINDHPGEMTCDCVHHEDPCLFDEECVPEMLCDPMMHDHDDMSNEDMTQDHHDMGSFEEAVGSMDMGFELPSICYCAGETEINGPADVPHNCIEEMSQICFDHFSDSVCEACASAFTTMVVTEDCFMGVLFEIHHICSSGHNDYHYDDHQNDDYHYGISYDDTMTHDQQDMGTDHHYDMSYDGTMTHDQDMGPDHYDMSYDDSMTHDQDMGTDHYDMSYDGTMTHDKQDMGTDQH